MKRILILVASVAAIAALVVPVAPAENGRDASSLASAGVAAESKTTSPSPRAYGPVGADAAALARDASGGASYDYCFYAWEDALTYCLVDMSGNFSTWDAFGWDWNWGVYYVGTKICMLNYCFWA